MLLYIGTSKIKAVPCSLY